MVQSVIGLFLYRLLAFTLLLFSLRSFPVSFPVGWMGGWLDKLKLRLSSASAKAGVRARLSSAKSKTSPGLRILPLFGFYSNIPKYSNICIYSNIRIIDS